MTDGFALPPEQVRAHAGQLDGHAAAVGEAHGAARSIQLGGDAYGKINFFMATAVNSSTTPIAEAIASAQHALTSASTSLRDAVEHQQAIDDQIAADLRRIAGQLGR